VTEPLIRPIRREELPALLELYRHLHRKDDPPPEGEALELLWDEILSDPRQRLLVIELEGVLVASCTLVLIPNLTRGGRPYGLIENVVTHADYRKRGIGRTLMQHALELAWSYGCYKVMLQTGRKDEQIMRFYERAGFQRGVKTGFVAYPPEGA
jgi:GNAT superfamily N-acetyltransferase